MSIPAAILKLLPRWIVMFGIALGICGELSWLNLIVPKTLFLVPLTRFPGFVWLIVAGFALPEHDRTRRASGRQTHHPRPRRVDRTRRSSAPSSRLPAS